MIVPELVDGCLLHCSLCWNRNRTPSFKQMELSTVEQVLLVFKGYRLYWFNWGEPLLHKEFITVADMVKDTFSAISSSLSMKLSDKQIDAIRKFKVVYVSLSGMCKETYHIYNRGGNFNQAIENLKTIAKDRRNRVIMQWEMHQLNEKHFNTAKAFAQSLNIEFSPFGLNCEVEDLIDGIDNMTVLEKDLLKTPKEYPDVHECPLIRKNIPIDVDGNFLLCCASHNVKIGIDIWDGFTFDELFDAKLKTEICSKCRENEHWRFFL